MITDRIEQHEVLLPLLIHLFEVRLRIFSVYPANNQIITRFTVRRSFSRLHITSKEGQKMSPLHATLKAIVKIFIRRKHAPVEAVLLIIVLDPY